MQIRPVDIHDDAAMRDFHRIVDVGSHVDREGRPRLTFEEYVGAVRAPDSGERSEYFAAYDDSGTMLGIAIVFLFLLDNTDKAWLEICVDPDHRGRGVGTALLDRVTAVAVADGRTELIADSKIPFDRVDDHPYRAFAERRGFSRSNVEVVRHLELPVEGQRLKEWTEHAAEKAEGYRLETFVGHFPDEYAESLCVLLGQLAVDAPTGDVDFEEEVMTPERLAERYVMSADMGRETYETVALTADGVVAAQSTLQVPVTGSTDAFQWGTFVHREHRGHRLGLAVKVATLQELQERHPHITRVTTQNAETNGYMIEINEQLGFRPVEASMEFVRRV